MESSSPIKILKSSLVWLGEFIQNYFLNHENDEAKKASLVKYKESFLKSESETIEELCFVIDGSYRRGSFGDLHPCIDEYKFSKCPLVVILALIGYKELLFEILNGNKDKNFFADKGQFAQFFSSRELKDSNLVRRYTFENFNFAHVTAIESYWLDEYKSFLNHLEDAKKEKCGVFGVQHKSHLYGSFGGFSSFDDEEKYKQGRFAKKENCSWEEIKELDRKVYKDAHGSDSDEEEEKKPKTKRPAVGKKVVRKSKI